MKKFVVLLIISIFSGVISYKYYLKQNNVYNVSLPSSYNLFEKNMFNVLQQLNEEEKKLLINYSLRLKNNPTQITVREAINDEKNFENSDEGIVFFSHLKEENLKNEIKEQINSSAFITFVDYSKTDTAINITFSLKNKTTKVISKVIGTAIFNINNENFSTDMELSNQFDSSSTSSFEKSFNFSEFPSMKEFNHNSIFKMKISSIEFSDGTFFHLN